MTSPLRLLMVEDSVSDAGLVTRHIKNAGYELNWERVESAAALRAAVVRQPWDLILCDYSMPDFSGAEALAIVRKSGLDMPFIFVSGTMGEDAAVEAMRAGAHDYVMKGNFKRLVPAIERELREAERRRELRQADAALRRLTVAVEAAANGIIITDPYGVILWTNPAFHHLSGYLPEEVRGHNPRLLKSGEHDAAFYRELWETILAGNVWHGEIINRHKDGHLYVVEQTITPVRNAAREIVQFVAIEQDVTERKQAEAEIQRLNSELERRVAERTAQLEVANQDLEAFCYSVSHDLRAPLRSIDGFSRLLEGDGTNQLSATGRDNLSRVRAAAERMGQLIDDLLMLSRLSRESMRVSPVNVSVLARSVIEELAQAAPERRVEIVIAPDMVIPVDARLLRIVFENLFGNAWKFTSKKPVARIEFGYLSGAGRESAPSVITCFVRDNGAGFDAAYAAKLFGVFQRLHSEREFPGTGIGLVIVQRIIRRHGGIVWAEGQVDQGATIYFTLPALEVPDGSQATMKGKPNENQTTQSVCNASGVAPAHA